ncbi:MAG: serine/threonine-protein kinase [Dokdonella sp.]
MTPMTEQTARALKLFDALVDLDEPAREAELAALRKQDTALAEEIARMLAADARSSGVLDQGLPLLAATLAPDRGACTAEVANEGRCIGPFTLIRLLGRGGMGEVWLARRKEGDFDQEVALKLRRSGMESDDMLRRFVQERRILADLSHPGIARFIDGGVSEQGALWYAMEYVEGDTLTDYARSHHLGVRERVTLMADVAEVVAYAQTHLIVHRDLKPSNILVDGEGRIRLLDFGIAKLLQGDHDARATATGVRAMSPAYAAPEQIFDAAISTATDVYALGVVLYELLTGSLPHERSGATLESLVEMVRHETPLRPSARLRETPDSATTTLGTGSSTLPRFARIVAGELDTIVVTALRPEPERRYASAAALAEDLRRWLDGRPVAAQPDTATYRMRKLVGRHRIAVGSASAVLLALIAGFGTALWQANVARKAAQRADAEAKSSEHIANFALSMVHEHYAYGRQTAEPRTPQQMLIASIDSARKSLKDDDRARATILGKLGEIQSAIDSPARAESAVVEALQLTRNLFGDAEPETGDALVALATVREQGDQLVEAEALLHEALTVYPRSPGNERSIAMTRSRLASILRRTGRIDDAIHELDLARASAEIGYGAAHPNTIELTGNGAMLLEQVDRLTEAEAGFRSAIAGYEGIDANFPRLMGPLSKLGLLLARTGRYGEARASMQRALAVGRRQTADPHVASLTVDYAEFLRRIGETEAAERARDAIDIKLLSDRPIQRSRLLRLNAQLLSDRGRHEDALKEFDRATTTLQGAKGDFTDTRASLDLDRADVLIAAGRWIEAGSAASSARESLAAETQPPTDLRTELARINARIAAHDGDLAGAEKTLASTIDSLTSITGPDTIEVVRLESDLADVIARTPGRADESARKHASARTRLDALGVTPTWAS